jgi:hypothetical protein
MVKNKNCWRPCISHVFIRVIVVACKESGFKTFNLFLGGKTFSRQDQNYQGGVCMFGRQRF